jgi:hypothetical protein
MLYKLVIGDWSDDGHGKSKDFIFDCNYDVSKIRQAYKDSCKSLGISFNHNQDYTGLNLGYGTKRQVWTEYEDCSISETAFEILKDNGCFKGILDDEFLQDINPENDDYEEELENIDFTKEDAAMIIMNFIALSMPEDFTYSLVKQEIEPINGWWNPELNVQFGYGLFS